MKKNAFYFLVLREACRLPKEFIQLFKTKFLRVIFSGHILLVFQEPDSESGSRGPIESDPILIRIIDTACNYLPDEI
jgi:hypothetical protein